MTSPPSLRTFVREHVLDEEAHVLAVLGRDSTDVITPRPHFPTGRHRTGTPTSRPAQGVHGAGPAGLPRAARRHRRTPPDRHGFGITPGFPCDTWHSHLATLTLVALGARPEREDDLVAYLLACRNQDGGYGNRPGSPSDTFAAFRATGGPDRARPAPAALRRDRAVAARPAEDRHRGLRPVASPAARASTEGSPAYPAPPRRPPTKDSSQYRHYTCSKGSSIAPGR
ncbi:prenyltransferase/squalene oxidase repeat-containing protein [Streptomyces sp. NPDC007905]|uniref:prenyltransferase/squalene oxidase repeat-containing protein n=1 Tax=Streptomyces sp. NPDC007905 TaxID=3364788 RepID=UPI0036E70406